MSFDELEKIINNLTEYPKFVNKTEEITRECLINLE